MLLEIIEEIRGDLLHHGELFAQLAVAYRLARRFDTRVVGDGLLPARLDELCLIRRIILELELVVAVDGPAVIGLRPIAEVDAEDCTDCRHTGRQEKGVWPLEQIVGTDTAEQEKERAEEPQKAFHTVTAFHQWYFSPRLILNAR